MNALIVLAHPEPKSFNGTLKDVAVDTLTRAGYTVEVSDLYGEGFDPAEGPAHYSRREATGAFSPLGEQRHAYRTGTLAPDVRREIGRLERADLVVFQFPLWWHAPPAILKGWFDRVFVSGGLYTSRMRYDLGYFRGRRAMVSMTSGAPDEALGPGSRGGDPDTMLWPVQYSLHYLGFAVLPPFLAHGIQGHGYAYRERDDFDTHLACACDRLAARLEAIDTDVALEFPSWGDWDESGAPLAENRDRFTQRLRVRRDAEAGTV